MNNCISIIIMLALTAVVNGCGSIPRPTPPSAGAQIVEPWGSVPLHTLNGAITKKSKDSFIQSLLAKRYEQRHYCTVLDICLATDT
jgi:hypothetical protein